MGENGGIGMWCMFLDGTYFERLFWGEKMKKDSCKWIHKCDREKRNVFGSS